MTRSCPPLRISWLLELSGDRTMTDRVVLYNLSTREHMATLVHGEDVTSVFFLDNNQILTISCNSILIWNVDSETGE